MFLIFNVIILQNCGDRKKSLPVCKEVSIYLAQNYSVECNFFLRKVSYSKNQEHDNKFIIDNKIGLSQALSNS